MHKQAKSHDMPRSVNPNRKCFQLPFEQYIWNEQVTSLIFIIKNKNEHND